MGHAMDTIKNILCRMCGETTEIHLNKKDFDMWKKGKPIQDALHYLSADQRELLLSGTCGTCFDKLFPPESD